MRVKICGLTRKNDVEAVLRAGADAIGFILAQSPRKVDLNTAKELACCIPPFVSVVAVVKNPTIEFLDEVIKSKIFDMVQFHGEEDPNLIYDCPLKTIKAIPLKDKKDLKAISRYAHVANFFLFDAKAGPLSGGTGKTFDWRIIKGLDPGKPFILAGGIGPENIEEAIEFVNPHAIDVNSAVESSPGIKDEKKIYGLMDKLKNWKYKF
ncbi:MAG: phosphoribosylanthranilate isomerase [Acetomicrobium sp.]|nr:phosphoribosylanthranilate isomerase [Acetomicrobium sp.]